MKKSLLRIAAAFTMLLGTIGVYAQQLQPLPMDSAVVSGTLDNGLTYYIRHNENPKGQADFYIAQKVGSILEEEHQRGLAHFLEHMCFNGTENFPGKNLINWLESIGVKFGQNLNAYTSIDETVYNISNVPTARTSVQDSCLLILHDWSHSLTLDPEEIDAERAVIHEEWRQSSVGQMRIFEKLLPVVYPDNKYGERLPIGIMEVVDNFPHQALIDYYHKWYRPDQQAIIVVGDVDPAYIEGKIKEMFGNIEMPENAAVREYVPVEDTPGTIYAIGADKEMQAPVIYFMMKNDNVQLPREYRNTTAFFGFDYMTSMIERMLNQRLAELSNKPEAEFAAARFEIGDFLFAKTKGALSLLVQPKGDNAVAAVQQVYREFLRAAKGGFTEGEYQRAKAELLSQLEKQYNERKDRKNESYSKEYVRFFVDNIPAPGIEFEKPVYEQLAQFINVDAINQLLPQTISEDNRVLLACMPENEKYTIPTEEQFAAAFESVDNEELEPYKDEMREDPLIPALPAPGKVVSTTHNDMWDATEYTLSNGVKVIVKPTDFKANEIIFSAIAKGNAGTSIPADKAAAFKYFPIAQQSLGLNDYSNSDLKKYLQGKQAGVSFAIGDYYRMFNGSTTVKDLPTLMEILYAYFTGFNLNEDEFTANRDAMAGMLANQESNPQFIFQRDITKALFDAPAKQVITSEDVKAAKREDIIAIAKAMTSNAADYTFAFVGAIDPETFVPLMEQYLGTLPADAATASRSFTNDAAFEVKPGTANDSFTTKMENPQTWVFITVNGKMPYNQKNKLLSSVSAQILSKRLLNKVREEMGATYSLSAMGDMDRTNVNNVMFQIPFPMKPEMKEEVLAVIKDMVNDMAANVSDEELKPVVEFMLKEYTEDIKENNEWAGSITATELNGQQIFLNRDKALESITTEDVKNFMNELLKQGNYRVITLDPETAE